MDKQYLNAKDIVELLGVKRYRAYEMIKAGNKELAKQGKYTMSNVISKRFLLNWLGLQD